MRAVSNTSPLCHAVWIGEAEILPQLFSSVMVPRAIVEELSHPGAPDRVRTWMQAPPSWLEVVEVDAGEIPPHLTKIHRGEWEAIQLARQVEPDFVLIDELEGRRVATDYGLRVTGLLGVLDQAGRRGLVDVPAAVNRLTETEFYMSKKLMRRVLARYQS